MQKWTHLNFSKTPHTILSNALKCLRFERVYTQFQSKNEPFKAKEEVTTKNKGKTDSQQYRNREDRKSVV